MGISPLYDEILPLNIAEFAKTREQWVVELLVAMGDETNPPNPGGLLGAQNVGPSQDRAANQCDEIATTLLSC